MAVPFNLIKKEHSPLDFVELGKPSPHELVPMKPICRIVQRYRGIVVHRFKLKDCCASSIGSHLVEADREDPRGESGVFLEGIETLIGLDECSLNPLFDVMMIAGELFQKPVQRIDMSFVQNSKRLMVARTASLNKYCFVIHDVGGLSGMTHRDGRTLHAEYRKLRM